VPRKTPGRARTEERRRELEAKDRQPIYSGGTLRFIAVDGFIDARHVDLNVAQLSSSPGTVSTKGTVSRDEDRLVWRRTVRCMDTSSSPLVMTPAFMRSPPTSPSRAGIMPPPGVRDRRHSVLEASPSALRLLRLLSYTPTTVSLVRQP
jgi:hypothetical protein